MHIVIEFFIKTRLDTSHELCSTSTPTSSNFPSPIWINNVTLSPIHHSHPILSTTLLCSWPTKDAPKFSNLMKISCLLMVN